MNEWIYLTCSLYLRFKTTSLSNVTLTHRTSKFVNPTICDSLVVLGALNIIYSVCTMEYSNTLVCLNKLVIFRINEL